MKKRLVCNGVKIIIKNLQTKLPINPIKIRKTVLKTLAVERIKKSGEITICFMNDKKIKEINAQHLKKKNATDVIAFNLGSKDNLLADIAVSTDTAIAQAKIFQTSCLYELYLYVVHGVLHILGYDDKTTKQKQIMQDKSIEILHALRIN